LFGLDKLLWSFVLNFIIKIKLGSGCQADGTSMTRTAPSPVRWWQGKKKLHLSNKLCVGSFRFMKFFVWTMFRCCWQKIIAVPFFRFAFFVDGLALSSCRSVGLWRSELLLIFKSPPLWLFVGLRRSVNCLCFLQALRPYLIFGSLKSYLLFKGFQFSQRFAVGGGAVFRLAFSF